METARIVVTQPGKKGGKNTRHIRGIFLIFFSVCVGSTARNRSTVIPWQAAAPSIPPPTVGRGCSTGKLCPLLRPPTPRFFARPGASFRAWPKVRASLPSPSSLLRSLLGCPHIPCSRAKQMPELGPWRRRRGHGKLPRTRRRWPACPPSSPGAPGPTAPTKGIALICFSTTSRLDLPQRLGLSGWCW